MRQYVSRKVPDKNGLLKITDQDFRYLRLVLRVRPGDMLSVRIPSGELINTTVSKINEKERLMILQVCSENRKEDKSREVTRGVTANEVKSESSDIQYYLFQFAAKPTKMELIIRQAVECGVTAVVPVIGEFSQKSSVVALEGAKNERFLRIIREAMQQSGSPIETKVLPPMTVEEAVAYWNSLKEGSSDGESASSESAVGFVLWERTEGSKSMKSVVSGKKLSKVALAVGCEGGISPSEVQTLSEGGFFPVHFEGNILRCETAALFGIAAVQTTIRNENE